MLRRAQAEADASQRGMSQGKCITRRINKQFLSAVLREELINGLHKTFYFNAAIHDDFAG